MNNHEEFVDKNERRKLALKAMPSALEPAAIIQIAQSFEKHTYENSLSKNEYLATCYSKLAQINSSTAASKPNGNGAMPHSNSDGNAGQGLNAQQLHAQQLQQQMRMMSNASQQPQMNTLQQINPQQLYMMPPTYGPGNNTMLGGMDMNNQAPQNNMGSMPPQMMSSGAGNMNPQVMQQHMQSQINQLQEASTPHPQMMNSMPFQSMGQGPVQQNPPGGGFNPQTFQASLQQYVHPPSQQSSPHPGQMMGTVHEQQQQSPQPQAQAHQQAQQQQQHQRQQTQAAAARARAQGQTQSPHLQHQQFVQHSVEPPQKSPSNRNPQQQTSSGQAQAVPSSAQQSFPSRNQSNPANIVPAQQRMQAVLMNIQRQFPGLTREEIVSIAQTQLAQAQNGALPSGDRIQTNRPQQLQRGQSAQQIPQLQAQQRQEQHQQQLPITQQNMPVGQGGQQQTQRLGSPPSGNDAIFDVKTAPIPRALIAQIPGLPQSVTTWTQISDMAKQGRFDNNTMNLIKKVYQAHSAVWPQQQKQLQQQQQQQQFQQQALQQGQNLANQPMPTQPLMHPQSQAQLESPGPIPPYNQNQPSNRNLTSAQAQLHALQQSILAQLPQTKQSSVPFQMQMYPPLPQGHQSPSANQFQSQTQSQPVQSTKPATTQKKGAFKKGTKKAAAKDTLASPQANITGPPGNAPAAPVQTYSPAQFSPFVPDPSPSSEFSVVNKLLSQGGKEAAARAAARLRSIQAEVLSNPVKSRVLTNISQEEKKIVSETSAGMMQMYSRIDQLLPLFFVLTGNEEATRRLIQMKFMYKHQMDNLTQGVFTCTPQHLEKLKEQIGRYFTFVKNQVQAGKPFAGTPASSASPPVRTPQFAAGSPDGVALSFARNTLTQENLKRPVPKRAKKETLSQDRAGETSVGKTSTSKSVREVKNEVKEPLEFAITTLANFVQPQDANGSNAALSSVKCERLGATPGSKSGITPSAILRTPQPFLAVGKDEEPITPPDWSGTTAASQLKESFTGLLESNMRIDDETDADDLLETCIDWDPFGLDMGKPYDSDSMKWEPEPVFALPVA